MTTSEQRAAVIAEALSWQGTPFVHAAMVKHIGVGCGAFMIACYGSIGIPVPDNDKLGYFPHDWHQHECRERYLEIISKFTHEVEAPLPGDIVMFRIGKVYGHSAIVIEWPQIIHVMWRRKVELADATKAPLDRRKTMFLSPFT